MSNFDAGDRARAELNRVLASELPITQHLGITVEQADTTGVALRLPLDPNRNHQGTMFAGSLNAVATLAGWATAWLEVARGGLSAAVVVQDSRIDYLRPVAGDCVARSGPLSPAARDRFIGTLTRHRRARLDVAVVITVGDEAAARFQGRFVALARGTGAD